MPRCNPLSQLAAAANALAAAVATQTKWLQAHMDCATKRDLERMGKRMAIKVSELTGEVTGLKAKVIKIWDEQQVKYDALVKKYDELVKQVENLEVPAETETALADFKTLLQQFDDTIPDTTA